jgi:hypothetical protein
MITKVSRYQTSDGKLFDDEVKAKEHENETKAITEILAVLNGTLSTGRPESIAKHIVMDAEAISSILARYRQRMPRQRKLKIAA